MQLTGGEAVVRTLEFEPVLCPRRGGRHLAATDSTRLPRVGTGRRADLPLQVMEPAMRRIHLALTAN